MTTGVIQDNDQTWSALVRFSDVALSGVSQCVLGSQDTSPTSYFYAFVDQAADDLHFGSGTEILNVSSPQSVGVIGIAGRETVLDGLNIGTLGAGTGSNGADGIYLGARNTEGSANSFLNGKIQAVAIYSGTLDASQVALITQRMNQLSAPVVTRLESHWSLDEESGTRLDSVGANDLTDNATVGFAAGVVGNAAVFVEGNFEHLSIADNASVSVGDIDFAFCGFINVDNLTNDQPVIGKYVSAGDKREYTIYMDSTADKLNFVVSPDKIAFTTVSTDTFGALSAATNYFFFAYHDSINNEIGISIDGGAVDTAAHTTGVADGTEAFHLGSYQTSDNVVFNFDGLIDNVFYWKDYVPTAEEITWLYNLGSGRSYAEMLAQFATWTPSALPGLTAWYDFSDETTLFTDAGSTQVTADADLIYQANDKSGSGNHVVQATAASRPLYKTGIQNNLSIARFDGADDFLLDTFTLVQPFSVFIVWYSPDADVPSGDYLFSSATGNRALYSDATNTLKLYSGALGPESSVTGLTWFMSSFILDGASTSIWADGGTPATGNAGTEDWGGVVISARSTDAQHFEADIAEILVCSLPMAVIDHNLLGNYLADKWGLTWTDIT